MVDSINRWLTHPDENIRAHIMETFGTDDAVKIALGTGDRAEGLKNLYQRQLRQAAKFVRYFEMRDRDNRLVYYLFFASNNPVGPPKDEGGHVEGRSHGRLQLFGLHRPEPGASVQAPSRAPLAAALAAKFRGAGRFR